MKKNSNDWAFPTKLLVIDDEFDGVQDFIDSLLCHGFPVQYWNSKEEISIPFRNIRIVILDLKLEKNVSLTSDTKSFYPAINALNKIPGPYVVIILSSEYEEGQPELLKKSYREFFDKAICGVVSNKGMSKTDEPQRLYELITETIEQMAIVKCMLHWEKLVDLAKDKALGTFTQEGLEQDFQGFMSQIREDVKDAPFPRELVSEMLRMLSRYMTNGKEFDDLVESLSGIKKPKEVKTEYFSNLRMYYVPEPSEKIWTGDIFKIENSDPWNYAIILNPVCDIAQEKAELFLACKGFLISNPTKDLLDPNHNYFSLREGKYLLDQLNSNGNVDKKQKFVKNYLEKKINTASPRTHKLWNFKESNETDTYSILCFDFQRLETLDNPLSPSLKWSRVCRLDSPFIEELIQRHSSYSTRLGVPGINRSL